MSHNTVLTISETKNTAKENLKGRHGISLLGQICDHILCKAGNIIPVVGNLLIVGPLSTGLEKMFYTGSKKEKPDLKELFSSFKENFGETFLAGILVNLFVFLWALLLVIPGIIKSYAYSMTYYLMMRDPELSATDAITLSRNLMNGNKGRLFLLKLSFIGWDLLCLITLGIAAIYVAPYKKAAHTVFFNAIYEDYTREAAADNAADTSTLDA